MPITSSKPCRVGLKRAQRVVMRLAARQQAVNEPEPDGAGSFPQIGDGGFALVKEVEPIGPNPLLGPGEHSEAAAFLDAEVNELQPVRLLPDSDHLVVGVPKRNQRWTSGSRSPVVGVIRRPQATAAE